MSNTPMGSDALMRIQRRLRQLERRVAGQRFLEAAFTSAPLIQQALNTIDAEIQIIERFLAPELDEFFPLRLMHDAIELTERERAQGRRIAPRKAVATVLVGYAEDEAAKRRALVRAGVSPDELPIHLLQAIANTPDVVDDLAVAVEEHFSTAKTFKQATGEERRRKQKATRPQQRAFYAATRMGITSRKSAGAYVTAYHAAPSKGRSDHTGKGVK